jgi:hypothetical protein
VFILCFPVIGRLNVTAKIAPRSSIVHHGQLQIAYSTGPANSDVSASAAKP